MPSEGRLAERPSPQISSSLTAGFSAVVIVLLSFFIFLISDHEEVSNKKNKTEIEDFQAQIRRTKKTSLGFDKRSTLL